MSSDLAYKEKKVIVKSEKVKFQCVVTTNNPRLSPNNLGLSSNNPALLRNKAGLLIPPYGNLATRLRNTFLKALEKVLEGLLKNGGICEL